MSERKVNLLYITKGFPKGTFITREVLEISRYRDLDLRIISFAKDKDIISPISPEIKRKVLYINLNLLKLLVFNVIELARSPVKYLKLAVLVLHGRNRLREKFVDLRFFFIGVTLIREIRDFNVDHIHAHWATWPTTIALILSRFLDVPFTFTAHANDIFADSVLLREKISLAEAAITCTGFNRNYLIGLTSPEERDKIFTIYHGIDFRTLRFKQKRTKKVPVVLAVGRLVSYKGFSYLIDALDLVREQGGNFRAVIIGGGPEFEKLRFKISEKNLTGSIELLGALPFKEVKKYFEKADILVAPSIITPKKYFDGIPNVLIEAMASKTPIVATNISGLPEAVGDGENGLLVEEKDAKALSEAIQVLLNDEELRRKFGEAGYRKALRMFDIEKNVKRLKQVILKEEANEKI